MKKTLHPLLILIMATFAFLAMAAVPANAGGIDTNKKLNTKTTTADQAISQKIVVQAAVTQIFREGNLGITTEAATMKTATTNARMTKHNVDIATLSGRFSGAAPQGAISEVPAAPITVQIE